MRTQNANCQNVLLIYALENYYLGLKITKLKVPEK